MKQILLTFSFVLIGIALYAQPPAGTAKVGDGYGEKIRPGGGYEINEAVALLKSGTKFPVATFSGKVVQVGPKKGAWMRLLLEDSSTVLVRMKHDAFLVPLALKEKTVYVLGELKMQELSVDELKAFAIETKRPKAEIDAITGPQNVVTLIASGILVGAEPKKIKNDQ